MYIHVYIYIYIYIYHVQTSNKLDKHILGSRRSSRRGRREAPSARGACSTARRRSCCTGGMCIYIYIYMCVYIYIYADVGLGQGRAGSRAMYIYIYIYTYTSEARPVLRHVVLTGSHVSDTTCHMVLYDSYYYYYY